ncbi:IS1 family transposase [Moheibacter sp. BDHS18]|uniref:IS1 family transposase n=1 Tax=Moheibacter lacus TaxID=2745851 RepID=A0A838ZTS5_9FLAO|nr:IS1 family transposase [Moheibacter lacus]
MKCSYCQSGNCIKNGKTLNAKSRYKCNSCFKRFILNYTYNAYQSNLNQQIIILTKEGLGIRSTARVLDISATTLLKRIISIANKIPRPFISKGKVYEVDELRTYIKSKNRLVWIVYALERESWKIVSFNVGARTNKTLKAVLTTLQLSEAKSIYTDGLRNYKYLIQKKIHKVIRFGTNHIERFNLNLRIHLKRLNRRTICFSKSPVLLSAVLKIYFWSELII